MDLMLSEEQIQFHLKRYREFERDHSLVMIDKVIFFISKYINDFGHTELEWATKKSKDEEWKNRKLPIYEGGKLKMNHMTDVMLEGAYHLYGIEAAKRWKNVVFAPNMETITSYNLWTGFPISPKQGDISIFVNFMRQIIGNDQSVEIIFDWFADIYQNPQHKPDWAIILRGDKGAGKNTIEEMLGRGLLQSANYFRTSDTTKLFGRFNGHLATNLLLVGQEIVWGGKKEFDSTLKEMITEKTRSLEKKGIDAITINNYTRIFITSNADWVVPASGKDERRYFVVNVTKSDHVDFKELYCWYENGGGREALMYEMIHRDLSGFNRHKAPKTKELEQQLAQSLSGVERFVYEALTDGVFGNRSDKMNESLIDDHRRCKATELYKLYLSINKNDNITQKAFGSKIKRLLWITKDTRVDGCKAYYLPPMRESIESFASCTGIHIETDPEHDWGV